MADFNQYSSAIPYFQGAPPPGLPDLDVNRLRSYELYEEFYWNHPESFRLLQRGEEENPIYLPSTRKIVEATLRYLAVHFDYVVETATTDPKTGETIGTGGGTDGEKQIVDEFFKNLFKRENFYSKFQSNKRFNLIRGDAIWHITADDTKEQGTRISIHDVHPRSYFPIYAGELTPGQSVDKTKRVGCYLVDTIEDPDDDTKKVDRVQTYMLASALDPESTAPGVTSKLELYEIGKWDARNLKPADIKLQKTVVPEKVLPTQITQIPVYHWKNTNDTGTEFGSSLVRGIETVLAAANQSISDEDLALVMAGLGGFWTDAAPPLDEATGEPTSWELGPLRMTEVPQGHTVGRLAGVGSVAPSQDHINMLLGSAAEGVGIPDIAIGKVDVTVAESGISLALQLAPLLAANAEREVAILGLHDQMFHDLMTMWLPAYENMNYENVVVSSIVGDPLPKPPKGIASLDDIVKLREAQLITVEEARQMMMDELNVNILDAKNPELEKEIADSKVDPFSSRVNAELGGNDTSAPDGSPANAGSGS